LHTRNNFWGKFSLSEHEPLMHFIDNGRAPKKAINVIKTFAKFYPNDFVVEYTKPKTKAELQTEKELIELLGIKKKE
jgi:hypothetical protein